MVAVNSALLCSSTDCACPSHSLVHVPSPHVGGKLRGCMTSHVGMHVKTIAGACQTGTEMRICRGIECRASHGSNWEGGGAKPATNDLCKSSSKAGRHGRHVQGPHTSAAAYRQGPAANKADWLQTRCGRHVQGPHLSIRLGIRIQRVCGRRELFLTRALYLPNLCQNLQLTQGLHTSTYTHTAHPGKQQIAGMGWPHYGMGWPHCGMGWAHCGMGWLHCGMDGTTAMMARVSTWWQ